MEGDLTPSELLVLAAVAAASNSAARLEDALDIAVSRLAEHAGWPVGHAWLRVSDSESLRASAVWHLADHGLHGAFRDATMGTVIERGEGLAGRVLAQVEPAWLQAAPPAGWPDDLRGGYAVPIVAEGEPRRGAGVPHARVRPTPDDRLLRLTDAGRPSTSRCVAERVVARDRFAHEALHDKLTDLPNRASVRGAAPRRARALPATLDV